VGKVTAGFDQTWFTVHNEGRKVNTGSQPRSGMRAANPWHKIHPVKIPPERKSTSCRTNFTCQTSRILSRPSDSSDRAIL